MNVNVGVYLAAHGSKSSPEHPLDVPMETHDQ
jgi:hypothetical protein